MSDNFRVQILREIRDFPARFAAKVRIDEGSGCWNWQGATHHPPGFPQYSYGQYHVDGRDPRSITGAHSFAYQFVNGPLSDPGLEVHHRCENTLCVNPDHLEAVTHQQNCRMRRKRERVPGSKRWRKDRGLK